MIATQGERVVAPRVAEAHERILPSQLPILDAFEAARL